MLTDYQLNCLCAVEMYNEGHSFEYISTEFNGNGRQMVIDGQKIGE